MPEEPTSYDPKVSAIALALAETEPSPTPELERFVLRELDTGAAETLRSQVPVELFEAHRPLPESAQERIAARLLQPPRQRSANSTPPNSDVFRTAAKSWLRTRWLALPSVAAAALFAFWFAQPEASPLGHYVLETAPGQSTHRDTPSRSSAKRRSRPGQPFELILRPDEPDAQAVEAVVFVRGLEGSLDRVSAQVERSPLGALRVEINWPQSPLIGELVVVVGRPQEDWAARAAAQVTAGKAWRRFTVPFQQ